MLPLGRPKGSNFFTVRVDLLSKGRQSNSDGVASQKSVSIPLEAGLVRLMNFF